MKDKRTGGAAPERRGDPKRTSSRERTVTRAKLSNESQREQAKKPHTSNIEFEK